MKCSRRDCNLEAHPQNGKYCSKSHAPYAYLSNTDPLIQSEKKTRGSTSKGHGDRFHRFKISEQEDLRKKRAREARVMRENAKRMRRISKLTAPSREPATTLSPSAEKIKSTETEKSEGNKTMKLIDSNGMPGTEGTNPSTTEKRETDESKGTPYMELPLSLIKSEQEKSHSMSLIDESTMLLKGFMTSLTKEQTQSPNHINAACNCAKQIHNLLRLKIDAIRVLK